MYYLRHHFDPGFDYTSLKPRATADGKADLRNLGYVQNVHKNDLLAELLPLEGAEDDILQQAQLRPEWTCAAPELPAGPHTRMEERNGLPVLLAEEDGYVFYLEGRITVKTLLNVRGNVDFHTGNINFVGDVRVFGEVATGFVVRGRNVLLEGGVDGSIVLARGDLAVARGARGNAKAPCFLQARGAIRLGFADKIELSSGSNANIQNAALHSHLFVGRRLGIGGPISGGSCQVWHSMAVRGDVGSLGGAPISITLGFDPWHIRAVRNASRRLEEVKKNLALLQPHLADPLQAPVPDLKRDLSDEAREHDGLFTHKVKKLRLWVHLLQKQLEYLEEQRLNSCLTRSPGLYVSGALHPGTMIDICGTKLQVRETMRSVRLEKEGDRIIALPLTAFPDEKAMAGLV